MPSLSSLATTGTLDGSAESVIARSLLPFATLHTEPGNRDRREQERDHGGRNRRALAETTREDAALIAQGRHQVRGIDGSTAGQRPDQLKVGKGEQHRE